MLNIWAQRSGYSFGTFQERTIFSDDRGTSLTLPTTGDITGVSFELIAGNLPSGLRIFGNKIVGTAFEVARSTESIFCVRASRNGEIADRTFFMTVEGPDAPEWVTPEGALPVNPNGLAFVLDNSYIDFQLTAIDRDLPAGDELEYFIEQDGGELPPGLSLSEDGRITGIVDPILALDAAAGNGAFDTNFFDSAVYDFGRAPTTGFETFLYDTITFDYSSPEVTPRKLNRKYIFEVSVSDGETVVKRKFSIFVVGDDFLRADNTILQVGNGAFTADSTYLRAPFWLTGRNLGIRRANNNVTVFLEAYDSNPAVGPVYYELAATNDDDSPSILPPGLFVDSTNGELFGLVPYQPAITKNYKFSVSVVKYDKENITEVEVALAVVRRAVVGQKYLIVNPLPQEDVDIMLGTTWRIGNSNYTIMGYEGVDDVLAYSSTNTYSAGNIVVSDAVFYIANADVPAGASLTDSRYWSETELYTFGRILLDKALIQDVPVSLGENAIRKTYTLSTLEFNTVKSTKTFELAILGEVESVIQWTSDLDLGTIKANYISTKFVNATTSVPNAILEYTLIGGSLPSGLTLSTNGNILGKVRQYGNIVYRSVWKSGRSYIENDVVKRNNLFYKCTSAHTSTSTFDSGLWIDYDLNDTSYGLTIIDNDLFGLDGRATSIDRQFTFSVIAQDQFQYSAIVGTFTLTVDSSDPVVYSNLYAKPYQSIEKRNLFSGFVNDSSIFTPNKIYRFGDPSFGIQSELKMLVYAGLETTESKYYALALTKNAKRKRFKMGEIKKAIARDPDTNEAIYEVIYIDVIDDQEVGSKSAPRAVRTTTRPEITTSHRLYDQGVSNLDNPAPNKFRSVNDTVTVNSDAVTVGGQSFYPTSVSNIRKNLAEIKVMGQTILTENAFLPIWMITPQDKYTPATGFVKAVPICYCLPGEADYILLNIKQSGFDFTQIDYEIDRLIIDTTIGETQERYFKFPNFEFNV